MIITLIISSVLFVAVTIIFGVLIAENDAEIKRKEERMKSHVIHE